MVFGASAIGSIFWLVSCEAFAVAAGLTSDPRFHGLALAMTIAAGQCIGFAVLYYFGDVALRYSAKLRERVECFDRERFERTASVIVFLGAWFGFPPLVATAVVAGTVRLPFPRFLSIVFIGRIIRFASLYYGGAWIMGVLGVELPSGMPF